MSDERYERDEYTFFLHFDVKHSRLPTHDVVESLKSVTDITKDLEHRLFTFGEGRIDSKVYVQGIEDGSFIAVIKITWHLTLGVVPLATAVAVLLETEEYATFHRELFSTEYKKGTVGGNIGKGVKNILQMETKKIDKITPDNINLNKSINAKSKFYKSIMKNQDVLAVGFDDSEEFPIKRKNFPAHISKPRKNLLPPRIEYRDVIIAAPNIVRKDYKWRFIDKATQKSFAAQMRDFEFREDCLNAKYPLKVTTSNDEILALFMADCFEINGEAKDENWRVMEVITFDGTLLQGKKMPNPTEISTAPLKTGKISATQSNEAVYLFPLSDDE